jgi:hypothetical protein
MGSTSFVQKILPDPRAERRLFTFSIKKLEYLKYANNPIFIDTESVSINRRCNCLLVCDIHFTKWKSINVVPRITKINFGAPQL